MNQRASLPLDSTWKNRLGFDGRQSPEIFFPEDKILDTPHASAIRIAFENLDLSAFFCIQKVPTVAVIAMQDYNRESIIALHGALWNQGLASLLLVITDDTLRVFSLSRRPPKDRDINRDRVDEFDKICLVETLNGTIEILKIQEIITGSESGRYWKAYKEFFPATERIDYVLLNNLKESHRRLCKQELFSDEAQALLMQTMFIAYLEDRGIISVEYFQSVSNGKCKKFINILNQKDVNYFHALFEKLKKDFNGDLFVAPCAFAPLDHSPSIITSHLEILADFRIGKEEMRERGGQFRFWGYDFKYIPVELISAVYDRFLGEREAERKALGAYYTPMFLVDTVVSQVWELLEPSVLGNGRFLDPACGSGVFLVCSFQRLCEYWRAKQASRVIPWGDLLAILDRVHGWDLNESAVRIAVFSLYVALLEEVASPDMNLLLEKGRMLPELWGKTLKKQNFFKIVPDEHNKYTLVIGNPPWSSRRGSNRLSVQWCVIHKYPIPSKEEAWAFTWKSMEHITSDGIVAFLLPAMGFLHNHSKEALHARQKLIDSSRIHRIINFADLRFQLFDGATRPAALIIFSRGNVDHFSYQFDYWCPKADLNLSVKRTISLSTVDRTILSSSVASTEDLAFKYPLWMREPDAKLFHYLSRFQRLGDFIKIYGDLKKSRVSYQPGWIIGQGFKPAVQDNLAKQGYRFEKSNLVDQMPYLPIKAFQSIYQETSALMPFDYHLVHSKGFEEGFVGPRVLISRGIATSRMRLQATYVESSCAFQDILQAVTIPDGFKKEGKILAALLNSRVAIWFAFHGTSSFGLERPEVKQAELLRLPFPKLEELPERSRAEKAAKELVQLVDDCARKSADLLSNDPDNQFLLSEIDRLSYEYFCLSANEIAIIEDTVEMILPAIQPSRTRYPELWKCSTFAKRQLYAQTLSDNLQDWLEGDYVINVRLEAQSTDLAILKLSLVMSDKKHSYQENNDMDIHAALAKVSAHIQRPIGGNFQLMPDFRIFIGNDLYLIKPMQNRFWLRSAALADASAIATDIQDNRELNAKHRGTE